MYLAGRHYHYWNRLPMTSFFDVKDLGFPFHLHYTKHPGVLWHVPVMWREREERSRFRWVFECKNYEFGYPVMMWNMFKVNSKTSEHFGVFVINFKHISHIFLVLLLLLWTGKCLLGRFNQHRKCILAIGHSVVTKIKVNYIGRSNDVGTRIWQFSDEWSTIVVKLHFEVVF